MPLSADLKITCHYQMSEQSFMPAGSQIRHFLERYWFIKGQRAIFKKIVFDSIPYSRDAFLILEKSQIFILEFSMLNI